MWCLMSILEKSITLRNPLQVFVRRVEMNKLPMYHLCRLTYYLSVLVDSENTRAAYPIEYIPNAKIPCVGPHPKNVILLACDAFGVLPPVSKLSLAQTMYHFISGYTALVFIYYSLIQSIILIDVILLS